MTTWTEAQIDRHLHLWEHRHGPDSPEAGIVRQLRAERDAVTKSSAKLCKAYKALCEMTGKDFHQHEGSAYQAALAALPTTQEKAKCSEND